MEFQDSTTLILERRALSRSFMSMLYLVMGGDGSKPMKSISGQKGLSLGFTVWGVFSVGITSSGLA